MAREPEIVVVTGAGAGLGRAIAREFGNNGAWVGLISRGKERLEAAKREIEASGGRALVLPTDVADPEQVERAADAVEAQFGPIDVWVNDAMTSVFAPVHEITPEEFKRVTEVTYLGAVYGTMAALRRMRQRDRGTIVQVGSALAYRSIPLQSAYCGAKHGIMGFIDSLRCELIHQNSHIHISIVQMPAMNTPQFEWVRNKMPRKAQPVPPIFQPEVGARAVYYAAHHRRREIYVGRSTVMAIVGQKIAPGLLDIYLGKTGYNSQQHDGKENPNRPDNLWKPVPADFAAHGIFDSRASHESPELWLDLNRRWLGLAALGAAAGIYALTGRNNGKTKKYKERVKRYAREKMAA